MLKSVLEVIIIAITCVKDEVITWLKIEKSQVKFTTSASIRSNLIAGIE